MHHFTSSNLNDTESYYLHSAKSKTCLDDDTMFHFCLWVQVSISVSVKVLFSDSTFKPSLNYESTHHPMVKIFLPQQTSSSFLRFLAIDKYSEHNIKVTSYILISQKPHPSFLTKLPVMMTLTRIFFVIKSFSGSFLSISSSCCAASHFLDLSLIAGHCI